jgi:hypothetical protein
MPTIWAKDKELIRSNHKSSIVYFFEKWQIISNLKQYQSLLIRFMYCPTFLEREI